MALVQPYEIIHVQLTASRLVRKAKRDALTIAPKKGAYTGQRSDISASPR